jgi:uncharacterized membrane protein
MFHASQIATVAIVMLALDAIWLTANNAYHRQVFATIQGKPMSVRLFPAAIVYILMIGAVWFFAVEPAQGWQEAAGRGALIGLAMYGVYDMTNYATLSAYPIQFAATDMMWGAFLCATTAAVAKAVA